MPEVIVWEAGDGNLLLEDGRCVAVHFGDELLAEIEDDGLVNFLEHYPRILN